MDNYQPNRECRCTRCRAQGIMGPVLMITVGVLFLLDNLWVWGLQFHRTWPVLLLVIGAVKILQTTGSTDGHAQLNAAPPAPPAPPQEVHNG